MTITDIKAAVDAGHSVKWASAIYDVCKSNSGEYLIVCQTNGSTVGLHGLEGTEYEHDLNGDPEDFYVAAGSDWRERWGVGTAKELGKLAEDSERYWMREVRSLQAEVETLKEQLKAREIN